MNTTSTLARREAAFCTVEEAARILGIGRSLAYTEARRYLATGGQAGLPVIRIGRRLLVPLAALERLMNGVQP